MNKTIYLRDEEGPVWERARELAGDKLSPVIVAALKHFIAEEEHKPRGFERIEVKFSDSKDHGLPKRKAFYGRWIFPPSKPIEVTSQDESYVHAYSVAMTAKGNAVFLRWKSDHEGRWGDIFCHYASLAEAAADPEVNYAARRASDEIGVPVEELDI